MTLTQITEKGIKDGEIINADINASAAIAKSKLAALDIVNADINSSAAIAGSKITPVFTSNIEVQNNAPGITFTDSNDSHQFYIQTDGDALNLVDATGSTTKIGISNTGHITLRGNVTVNDGYLEVSNSNLYIEENITHAGDGDTRIRFPAADAIALETGGNSSIYIDSSGNVGIGTTSPSETLHVLGDSSSTFPVKWIRGGSSVAGYLYSDSVGSGIVGSGKNLNQAGIYLVNNSRIDFRVNGSERMRIDSSGNVGIGTTSPDTLLHLSGADTAVIRLENTDTSLNTDQIVGGLEFEKADSSGAGAGVVGGLRMKSGVNGITTYLTLSTSESSANDVERIRITHDGKVGIGTTSPNTTLHIVAPPLNTATLTTTNCLQLGLWVKPDGTESNTSGHIYTGITLADGFAGMYGVDAGSGAANHLAFFTGAAAAVSERMRITSVGRVAIGTTSPDASLHIKSPDGSNARLILEQTQDAANYQNAIDFKNAGTQYAGIVAGKDASNNSFGIKFHTTSSYTERMQITDSGHVKITSGNLEFANGSGIDFSAVPDGSRSVGTDGNKLDDYEEGTWSPSILTGIDNGSGGSPTYQIQNGSYIKIGRLVQVSYFIQLNTTVGTVFGTAARLHIGGLPFTIQAISGQHNGFGSTAYHTIVSNVGNVPIMHYGAQNNTFFECYYGSSSFSPTNNTDQYGRYFIGGFTYHTNA